MVNHFGGEDLTNIVLDLPEDIRLCQGWGGKSYKLFCEYEKDDNAVYAQKEDGKTLIVRNFNDPKTYYLNDEIKNQNKKAEDFKTSNNVRNSINEKDRQYIILRKKQIKLDNQWYDYYIMKDGPVEDPDTSVYGDAESAEDQETQVTNNTSSTNDTPSNEESTAITYEKGVDAQDLTLLNAVGDIGFTLTDLVYPNTSNDFIASKGSSVVDSLDSIKNVLENYEYFYDVEGKFRFQEIKNYLNTSQSTDILESLKAQMNKDNENLNVTNTLIKEVEDNPELTTKEKQVKIKQIKQSFNSPNYSVDKYRDTAVYDFTGSPLIIDISNDPQYSLVKNDFVIWGTNGAGLPIRYHVAIDDIPDSDWRYEGYWMYSKMVALDTSIDSVDTTEDGYVTTLTCLEANKNWKTKADFPKEGQLDTFYYIPSVDYEKEEGDCDKVYYWNGVDYYILYTSGSGQYSFILDESEEEALWKEYGDEGSKEWQRHELEDSNQNKSNYYSIQVTEENKEKKAAQVALDHAPYIRTITNKSLDDGGTERETVTTEIADGGRGYQVRYVMYNTKNDWRSSIFLEGKINENQGLSDNNYYYAELKNEWPKIVDIQPPVKEENRLIGSTDSRTDDDDEADGVVLELKDSLDLTQATYYLDILNPSDRIKKFSVPAIGRKTDVYSETGVNCVFENDLPPYVYLDNKMTDIYKTVEYTYTPPEDNTTTDDEEEQTQVEPIPQTEKVLTDFSLELMLEQINKKLGTLTIDSENIEESELNANQGAFLQDSYDDLCKQIKMITELGYNPVILYHSQYKKLLGGGTACSAYEQAKNIIYQGTGYNEKVTVTMMPVYYLEPNTRIRLQDTQSGVNGDYIIDSIDLPLDGTGTMSLVCSRALDKM